MLYTWFWFTWTSERISQLHSNSHNGTQWNTTTLCCTDPVLSLPFLVKCPSRKSKTIDKRRYIAKRLTSPSQNGFETSWPATKCMMVLHCSRDSRSYPKCSTTFTNAASILVIAYAITESYNWSCATTGYSCIIIMCMSKQRTQKSWRSMSLRQELGLKTAPTVLLKVGAVWGQD